MRPLGLHATQFTILQVLSLAGELTQGDLGEILALDSTTLTRTLKIMVRQHWIAKKRGKDRREWRLHLAKNGKIQMERANPYWEKVQAELRDKLGSDHWNNLLKLSNEAANAITNQGDCL